ncbi:MAG: FHA domain-containing protein [Symploca sp. SIO2G7]|nr:FHA domain-containing protein [Symploca sp. SIO2G7]
MAYPNNLAEYHIVLSAEDEADLDAKLDVFQAFSKLCQHDRELLDALLALNVTSSSQLANYIQGVCCDQQVYIVSNLLAGKSKRFYSANGLWTIGRDPRQSDIAISDKRLSRCHAALHYDLDQGFVLSDLKSTNGTYVNGEKLKKTYPLHDGDRIRIGGSLFYFFTCETDGNRANATIDVVNDKEGEETLH